MLIHKDTAYAKRWHAVLEQIMGIILFADKTQFTQ